MTSVQIPLGSPISFDRSQEKRGVDLDIFMQHPQSMTVTDSLPGEPQAATTASRVDFTKTSAPSLQGTYLCMLDNVFTADECQALVSAAEAHTGGLWEEVRHNYDENGIQSTRTCKRILFDSRDFAAMLWRRIENQVPELKTWAPQSGKVKWPMSRLNERTRFLKYQPKQQFQRELPIPPFCCHFYVFVFGPLGI